MLDQKPRNILLVSLYFPSGKWQKQPQPINLHVIFCNLNCNYNGLGSVFVIVSAFVCLCDVFIKYNKLLIFLQRFWIWPILVE